MQTSRRDQRPRYAEGIYPSFSCVGDRSVSPTPTVPLATAAGQPLAPTAQVIVALLALWSLGLLLARRCRLDGVAGQLARLRRQSPNTTRQGLAEWLAAQLSGRPLPCASCPPIRGPTSGMRSPPSPSKSFVLTNLYPCKPPGGLRHAAR